MSNRALSAALALSFCLTTSLTEAHAQVIRAPSLDLTAAVDSSSETAAVVPPLRLSAEIRQAVASLEQAPRLERSQPSPRIPPSTMVLGSLYVSTAVMHGLDVHSTLRGIRSGAVEANPVMKGLVNRPAAFIAAKAAVGVGMILAARTMAKKHKMSAVIALAAINAVYGATVHHNYQVAQRMR